LKPLTLDKDLVADDDPGSVEELAPYADGGRAFVSVGTDDRPVAYLLPDLLDGATATVVAQSRAKRPS
jgi:hypothetical protein